MLEIKLFGPGEFRYCGQSLGGFPHQAPYLLLCYLLLNRGHPHNRERLAAIFWSEATITASRKTLRNTLWRLRHGLSSIGLPVDAYFHLEEEIICFLQPQSYWLDVEVFEQAAVPLQDVPGQSLAVLQVTALESAAALYTGDLLEGIYEDWCLYDRERLRLVQQGLLSKLMVYHGARGSYEQGIAHGIRLLAMDNTWEKTHRQLMWLYCLSGDRCAALAQYKLCQQILNEELGISPVPETCLLYEQMLHNQFDPRGWLEISEPLPKTGKPPSEQSTQVASRIQGELRKLREMLDATHAETRLIEKLIDEALNL